MRAFVAIFPPAEVQEAAVAGAREAAQHLGDRVRWTRSANVHLTLKFLGDIREEALGDLRSALRKACEGHSIFDVVLGEFGAFPSARRARILWAGVDAGTDHLRALATDLDAALAPLGFEPEERGFAAHLTVGRVRGRPVSVELSSDTGGLGFRVRRVDLVESTLTPAGALYRTVEAFGLGN